MSLFAIEKLEKARELARNLAELKNDAFTGFEQNILRVEIDGFPNDDARMNVGRRRHHGRRSRILRRKVNGNRRVGIAEVDGDVERRMSLGVPDEREEEVVARGLHHRHLSVSQGGLGPKFGGGDEGLEDGSIVAESPFEFDVDVRSVISDGNPRLAGSKSRVGATVPLHGRKNVA